MTNLNVLFLLSDDDCISQGSTKDLIGDFSQHLAYVTVGPGQAGLESGQQAARKGRSRAL